MKDYLCLFITLLLFSHALCELKSVIQFFNGGARSPLELNNTNYDIFEQKWDRQGIITEVGLKQLFTIGQKLSNHYNDKMKFLNTTKINAYSINKEHNLISAHAIIQGLYQEKLYNSIITSNGFLQNEEDNLFRRVFPIQNFNILDIIDGERCLRLEDIIHKNIYKESIKRERINFSEKNYDTKFNKKYFLNHNNLLQYCDTVLASKINNRDHIISNELFEDCKNYLNITYYEIYNNDNINRFLIQKVIYKIIDNFDSNQSIYDMYSINNEDLASILYFLNKEFKINLFYPDFNSVLIFELFNISNIDYIRVYFGEKHLLTIPYIRMFQEFENIMKPEIVLRDFCSYDHSEFFNVLLIILLFIISAFFTYMIIKMTNKNFKKDKRNEFNILNEHKSNEERSFIYDYSHSYLHKN